MMMLKYPTSETTTRGGGINMGVGKTCFDSDDEERRRHKKKKNHQSAKNMGVGKTCFDSDDEERRRHKKKKNHQSAKNMGAGKICFDSDDDDHRMPKKKKREKKKRIQVVEAVPIITLETLFAAPCDAHPTPVEREKKKKRKQKTQRTAVVQEENDSRSTSTFAKHTLLKCTCGGGVRFYTRFFPHTCHTKSSAVPQVAEDVPLTTQQSPFAAASCGANPTPVEQKKKKRKKVAASHGDNDSEEKRKEKQARIKRATLTSRNRFIDAYKRVPDDPSFRWKPPTSPYGLLQEKYYQDPWKVLIICILCNRTKGQEAGKVLEALFAVCSSPEETTKIPAEKIEYIIRELGLQRKRAQTIKRLSEGYLKDWQYVTQLHGIGKYAADAYAIFCSGHWQDVNPIDHKLELYWKFLHELDQIKKNMKL